MSSLPKDLSEVLQNVPPEERSGWAAKLIENPVPVSLESPPDEAMKKKPLKDFQVDHQSTIGMSWDEIDNLRPPFVIDGFLRRGEVLLLGAESKSRKSWLAQDAGFCVSAGIRWLASEDGTGGFETARAHVHVIDLELSKDEILFRFAKARAIRFAKNPAGEKTVTEGFRSYSFDGIGTADILYRLEEIKPTVKVGDLVIIDCLYRLAPDGNEAKEIAEIMETVKRFASETKSGVILVDHFRKAGDDKARNRFAGSFIKQASASTLVAIEVDADGMLTMNIDARTFHGCPKAYAMFNMDTYTFDGIPEA